MMNVHYARVHYAGGGDQHSRGKTKPQMIKKNVFWKKKRDRESYYYNRFYNYLWFCVLLRLLLKLFVSKHFAITQQLKNVILERQYVPTI